MEDGGGALRRSAAWLVHPATVAALVVMIVNDHYLKHTYGSWTTGKLSDAAGLVFFPPLLAVLGSVVTRRASWRTVRVGAIAATALGFAWVKVTAVGAAAASGVLTAIAGPSVLRQDATDLLALPFLALAALIATRPATRAVWRVAVVMPVAVLASVATSAVPVDSPRQVTRVDGDVTVGTWEDYGDGPSYARWWVPGAGGSFDLVDYTASDTWGARVNEAEPKGSAECLPGHISTCYRPYQGHLGVERSTDGGTTWSVDWEIPEGDRLLLAGALQNQQLAFADPSKVQTFDIAIVGDDSGYVVWAANGQDGLAMRDEAGHWDRVYGFNTWDGFVPPMPLPSEEHYRAWYALPPALVAFGVGLFLALVVITFAYRTRGRGGPACGLYWIGAAIGGFGAAFSLLFGTTRPVLSPVAPETDFILGASGAMFLGLGGVLLIIALGYAAKQDAWRAFFAALGATLVGTAIATILPSWQIAWLWVALGVTTVLSVVAAALLARRVARTAPANFELHPPPVV